MGKSIYSGGGCRQQPALSCKSSSWACHGDSFSFIFHLHGWTQSSKASLGHMPWLIGLCFPEPSLGWIFSMNPQILWTTDIKLPADLLYVLYITASFVWPYGEVRDGVWDHQRWRELSVRDVQFLRNSSKYIPQNIKAIIIVGTLPTQSKGSNPNTLHNVSIMDIPKESFLLS